MATRAIPDVTRRGSLGFKNMSEIPMSIVGELSVSEMRHLEQLRIAADGIVMEIGTLEVRKAHLLAKLSSCESQAQEAVSHVGVRLNIPKGVNWEITPDGKVLRQGNSE